MKGQERRSVLKRMACGRRLCSGFLMRKSSQKSSRENRKKRNFLRARTLGPSWASWSRADRASALKRAVLWLPSIVTSIHDPVALAATCADLNLSALTEGCISLGAHEASGWVVRLQHVRYPIVADTLTGLVAYHPHDNGFWPYARIVRFIQRYYEVRHQQHSGGLVPRRRMTGARSRRRYFSGRRFCIISQR